MRFGIGSGERAWSDVKQIKDGKRSNLGGNSLEKRAIFFTTAYLEEDFLLQTIIIHIQGISLVMTISGEVINIF